MVPPREATRGPWCAQSVTPPRPPGRILVVATRTGPVGFLVDEVVRVLR
jgi:hypothetical protein